MTRDRTHDHAHVRDPAIARVFTCRCGSTTRAGTLAPIRCEQCPDCGTNLSIDPAHTKKPEKHDFAVINDVKQCRRCGTAEAKS